MMVEAHPCSRVRPTLRGGRVEQRDLERTLATFGTLSEFELALADMYRACALRWPRDPTCWEKLIEAEEGHAGSVKRLAGLVASRSLDFCPGRPLTSAAVERQVDYVHHRTHEYTEGLVSERQALLAIRDLEHSILESHFFELVHSPDQDYAALVATILDETKDHVAVIDKRLEILAQDARG